MVYIVGIGPGSKDYILPKAIEILKKSNEIIGFNRVINDLNFINTKKTIMNSLKEIIEYIEANGQDNVISLVASGDPTFFGISEYIRKNYQGNIEVVPGLSSFQYLTSKLNKSWSYAFTGSIHGRKEEFIAKVKENKLSIWLTDNKNNCTFLCNLLNENNIECNVIIGEYLSYENERILQGKPKEFLCEKVSNMAILIVEKEG
ncbi:MULTISPECIES: precorrin-6y C5,15-methyltransferase (decarboxylating) subunit CbiE [unclassified Clostridium]|uniref:precorrin-6y C5,15-methyltransferase (decarboxylating) subunit CbiE n=1 Tax=unclassified Clostridium TaxID=2614128 RepID=UPI001C8C786B|nr:MULTISPECIES: precorrin-6y C5,15-methyltransferase (decarboxylating) subunit CbiE [unclassified Clostridium]MBX9138577.1 precorrin-6y C5,15-methyltransferase (decarboxylating) subunit CbiE [Clostridium sp. K12(2020)]MBX9145351.1 precorrin-6y C5,15-methyltransferase (decarboxylating) subunit CbiE [Clostridium sp. K13]